MPFPRSLSNRLPPIPLPAAERCAVRSNPRRLVALERRIMAILDDITDDILRPSNHIFPDASPDNPNLRGLRHAQS